MICHPCRNSRHTGCPGGTHCTCQHRTDRRHDDSSTIGALYEHVRENGPVVIDGWRITAWDSEDTRGDTYAAPVTATGFDTEGVPGE